MFENRRRGRQARNFTTNVPKILHLKSSSEQIFSENWRWVPLLNALEYIYIYILKFPTFYKNLCIPYFSQLRRHKFLRIICFKMFPWLAIPISYPTSSTFSLLHNIVRNLKRNYLDDFQVHLLDELQYKNNVIGVTEINITDPNFFGLHVEKFGTLVGGPIFHGWPTCQSIISHLRFPIGLLLPKCHESFARPHRLLLCHVLRRRGN